ncbi:uncharacterized protein LOC144878622 [Branchiostoma floridae x Branchiostoma japonicum]
MTTVKPIFLVVMCEAVIKMAATSTTPALPICPSGFGWDPQLEDCLPYTLCDTAPNTSICSDLPQSGTTAGKPRTSEHIHLCPAGMGWNQFLEDCQACSVCDNAPNTSICPYCHTVSVKDTPYRHLGSAVGLGASALGIACFVVAALWYKKHAGKVDEKLKMPIQETAGREISPGHAGGQILERVTVV